MTYSIGTTLEGSLLACQLDSADDRLVRAAADRIVQQSYGALSSTYAVDRGLTLLSGDESSVGGDIVFRSGERGVLTDDRNAEFEFAVRLER